MKEVSKEKSDEVVSYYTQRLTFIKKMIFVAVVGILVGLAFVICGLLITAMVREVYSLLIS
jgi:hypothetical protein